MTSFQADEQKPPIGNTGGITMHILFYYAQFKQAQIIEDLIEYIEGIEEIVELLVKD